MSARPDGNRLIEIFGTDEAAPEEQTVSAGKLSVRIADGQIKSASWDGKEIVRGISYLLRDANWATPRATSTVSLTKTTEHVAGAKIMGTVDSGDIRFDYEIAIEADAAGTLRIQTTGTAKSAFAANRVGLTFLHPVPACCGLELRVTHTDGTEEATRFPMSISPSQPVFDIGAMSYALSDDEAVDISFRAHRPDRSPQCFEMEDQRNWTDASYKTYIGSLLDPWPFHVRAGDVFRQEIAISIRSRPHAAQQNAASGPQGADQFKVPAVGVAVPLGGAAEALDNLRRYGSPGPRYVSAYLRSDAIEPNELAALRSIAEMLACPVTVELEVRGEPAESLAAVAGSFTASGVKVDSILACPAPYMKSYQPDAVWPDVMPLEAFYDLVRSHFPQSRIGGGMLAYFTELNRKWPPAGAMDYVGHALCPIVHAADDETVVQNIESLPFIAGTVAEHLPGVPYQIVSALISMRQNPYGAAPQPNPGGNRIAMADFDPRENGLFAGMWMLRVAEVLSGTHAEAVCLGALSGPASVYSPGWPNGKRPSYFALEALAAMWGAGREAFDEVKRQLFRSRFAAPRTQSPALVPERTIRAAGLRLPRWSDRSCA